MGSITLPAKSQSRYNFRMKKVMSHREEMFGRRCKKGEYLWCIHCERTYPCGKYREVADDPADFGAVLQMCPYSDCNGDAVFDAKDWDFGRQGHPEYPDVPVEGVVYPLY
jgi:hypothetical protein